MELSNALQRVESMTFISVTYSLSLNDGGPGEVLMGSVSEGFLATVIPLQPCLETPHGPLYPPTARRTALATLCHTILHGKPKPDCLLGRRSPTIDAVHHFPGLELTLRQSDKTQGNDLSYPKPQLQLPIPTPRSPIPYTQHLSITCLNGAL